MMLGRSQSLTRCIYFLCPTVSTATIPHINQRRWAQSNATKSLNESRRRAPSLASASDVVLASPPAVQPYLQIMRLDKPIGTWLLYWPCTWSIALATPAGHLPSLYYLALFGVGAILMRSAGCVINDLFDKEYDKRVERTKNRPLACGSLTEKQAIALLGGLLATSLTVLLQMNWFSVAVGSASMLLVVVYPLAKRYTYWPQFVLGATLNWGVLIAWAELLPRDQFYTVLPLYVSTVLHTVIYDTIYSHQDKTDDIMIGVKSTALRFGDNTKPWLCGFGTAAIAGLGLTGYIVEQTWPYYVALAGTAAHLAWQVGTVNINDSNDCWKKFKSNQWMGAILFAGIVAGTYLKKEKKDSHSEVNNDDLDEY
nr:UbiA prenyltransferase domain containing protein [Haemonchus contortus]